MRIYNPVRYIPKEAYEEEFAKYIDHVRDTPGLEAVYAFGSENVPGLSDLDAVCVVRDDFDSKYASLLDTNCQKFNPELFVHGPIVMPRSLFGSMSYLLLTINLKEVWRSKGAAPLPNLLTPSALPEATLLAFLVDYSEQKLGLYDRDLERGKTDKRNRLRAMSFFIHSEHMFKLLKLPVGAKLRRSSERMQEIRNQWKKGAVCSDGEFLDLYRNFEPTTREAFLNALEISYEKMGRPKISTTQVQYQAALKTIICSDKILEPKAKKWYVQVGSYGRVYMKTYAPIHYAAHLECYQDSKRGVCTIDENEYVRQFRLRSDAVRKHNEFLDKKRIDFSPRTYTGLPTRLSRRRDVRFFDRAFWFFERLIVK